MSALSQDSYLNLETPLFSSGGSGSQGPQGPQGPAGGGGGSQGAQGATGPQGAEGAQGAEGTPGVGSQGAQGAEGAQGAQGSAGNLTLTAGTNISLVPVGSDITINAINFPLVNRSSGNTPLSITATTQGGAQTVGSTTITPTFLSDLNISATVTFQTNSITKTDIFFFLTVDAVIVGFVFANTQEGTGHYTNCSVQGTALGVSIGSHTVAVKAYASRTAVFSSLAWQVSVVANLI